jgi:flagellar assembly factor FliW
MAATATLESTDAAIDVPVLEFVAPIPGFPDYRRFVLVRVTEEGVLYALTAVDEPELRFLVVPPAPFFPDYAPEIDSDSLAALGATDADAEGLMVLIVVTAGDTAGSSTANLMAPIVVHQGTRRAIQLILSGSGLPIHAVLMPAA